MKLTTFTDYSLRVLMYLAAAPERRATISQICVAFGVKKNHLTKVVHHLGKHGWVATTRGKGGGLMLAKAATDIRIAQVVQDTEGKAMPAECFAGEASSCTIRNCCHMKDIFGEAVSAFYQVLDRYSLADITRNREEIVSILHFRPTTRRSVV